MDPFLKVLKFNAFSSAILRLYLQNHQGYHLQHKTNSKKYHPFYHFYHKKSIITELFLISINIDMQAKSTSQSKRPPPKISSSTPKSSSQSRNCFKTKIEENDRPNDIQLIEKQMKILLQEKLSINIDPKILSDKVKRIFDPLKPIEIKKCIQQCVKTYLDTKSQKLKEWKEKNTKIVEEISLQISKLKQYQNLTNKHKQESQILTQDQDQDEKGQYINLQKKKRKDDIILDYKRIRNNKTLLERIIEGQILVNFMKFYRIIPQEKGIINRQIQEHYDLAGLKQLEKICNEDELQPIQIQKIRNIIMEEKRMSSDIQRYLQNIEQLNKRISQQENSKKRNTNNNEVQSLYDQLIKQWILIQNDLNIINISQFIRLIKLNQLSNNQIKDKNIALLIGPSGAGKTTIMLRMLGYQLINSSDNLTGLKTLMPRKKIKTQHSGLISRPGAQSVTQTIFAAELEKKYITELQNLYICDTPGFFDSSGPVVDLVNGISLINSIKKAKSVKPIIVISANMVGQRLEGVKKLGKIVSNLLTKFDKNEEGLSIVFIFNKFSNNQEFLRLEPGVKNILQNLSQTDKINTKYVRFLQLLHQTLFKKNEDKYILFKPYTFEIESTIKILQENLIQQPNQIFQYSHSVQTIQILQLFMRKKMQLINFYLENCPQHSYFHLQQVKILIDHLKIGQYENDYSAIKKEIQLKSQEYFTRFKFLLSEQTWKDHISDGQITESKEMHDKLMKIQIFREKGQCSLYSHKDINPIIDSVLNIFKEVKNKIQKNEELSSNDKNIVKKMPLFCKYYNQQSISTSLKDTIMKRHEMIMKNLQQFLKKNQFEDYKDSLEKYKKIQIIIKLLDNDNNDGQKSKKDFHQILKQKYQNISIHFKQNISQMHLLLQKHQLKKFTVQINIDQNLMQQMELLFENQFSQGKKQRQQSIQKIKNTILKLQSDYLMLLKSKNQQNTDKLLIIMANLEVISQFQKLSRFVQAINANILNIIETTIDDYMKKLRQIYDKLEKGQISSTFSNIYTIIYSLTHFPKLLSTTDKQTEVQRVFQEIQQDFIIYMKKIIQKTRTINTTLKSLLKNDNLVQICNRLRQLKYVQNANLHIRKVEYLDDLEEQIAKFIEVCKIKRQTPLLQIKKTLQNAQKHPDISTTIRKVCEDYQKYYQYLQQVGELLTNKVKPQQLQQIKDLKNNFFKKIQQQYGQEFQKVKTKKIWQLSIDQQISYLKRLSSLTYLQESDDQEILIQIQQRRWVSDIYQHHLTLISNSIKLYSNDDDKSSSKKKLQIGQRLMKFNEYLDAQDKRQLSTLIKRYQNSQYEASQIELTQMFSTPYLDFNKLQSFQKNHRQNQQIMGRIQDKIQNHNANICQQLKKLLNNPSQIQEIQHLQNHLMLLEYAIELVKKEEYLNSFFIQEVIFQLNLELIKQVLQIFKSQFKNVFQKINISILKIDYNSEQISRKINNFERLQRLIQQVFAEEYTDWKQNLFIHPLVGLLKNIPYLQLFPFHKYLTSLSTQIRNRRSKDITNLLDPKNQQSLKFFPSLSDLHKKQYLKPLQQEYQQMKSQLQGKGRRKDYDSIQKQMKTLINLFPQQLREQYQNQVDQISDRRKRLSQQLNRRINITQIQQLSEVFIVLHENSEYVNQDHIQKIVKKIEQTYEQVQYNDRTSRNSGYLEQCFEKLENVQENIIGMEYGPIKQAFQEGKRLFLQNTLKKAGNIVKQMIWESPLMIPSVKQFKKLQNKYEQLIRANKLIGKCKKDDQNDDQEHSNQMDDIFAMLIEQYRAQFTQEMDKKTIQTLMDVIRSKFFIKNIIYNLRTFLITNNVSQKYRLLLQIQPQNDWFNQMIKIVQQYENKSYRLYQITLIDFRKINNQNILKEKLVELKHHFKFLITLEEIQQNLKKQDELNFYEAICHKSCLKQLKRYCDSLQYQAKQEISSYNSSNSEHCLQVTIFYTYFLSLWEDEKHKKYGFINRSSLQFTEVLTNRLSQLTQQAFACLRNKQEISASRVLNILTFFQKLKYKFVRSVAPKIDSILLSLRDTSTSMKVALNQELVRRQSQPCISFMCTNYKQFKHIKQLQFSLKTKVKKQQYLQKFLKENNEKSQYYKESLNTIFTQFQRSICLHRQSPTQQTKQTIIAQIKSKISDLPVERILGKIFAVCSIIKKQSSCSLAYFQPHASQVIAVLTLLKIDESTTTLQNNLVEIPTGEGKSIVLGISACYLALRGFQVYHSCYSPILIYRDRMEFSQLYKLLRIQHLIFYGSFQETCENILPAKFKELIIQKIQQSDFFALLQWFSAKCQLFVQTFKNVFKSNLQKLFDKKKILLLDEVDVLLSPDYYNKLYIPTIDIKDCFLENRDIAKHGQDLITNLYLEIQEKIKKNRKFKFLSVDQFDITEKIVKAFPQIKEILFNIIKQIVHAIKNSKTITELSNSIFFKDRFRSQKCDSYQQLIAGVQLFRKRNISYDELKKSLKIRIKVCELSYSELPKYFSSIIGASGTLKTLTERKRSQLIQQYQMRSLYYLPTIYAQKRFTLQRVCLEKSKSKYSQILTKTITNHFAKGGKRAVLALFEDQQRLKQFKQGISFNNFMQTNKNIYDLNMLQYNKENFIYSQISNNIIKTTKPNTITLATKQFARGIDFKDDANLQQGLFVIIAFLPDSEEEYLQAKGRTARAGSNGKVFLCANAEQLLDSQDDEDGLKKLFIKKEQEKMNQIKDSVQKNKEKHNKTLEVYTNQKTNLNDYLSSINKYDFIAIRMIIGVQITLPNRDQILKNFEDKISQYQKVYSSTKNIQIQVRVFGYGNYIDLVNQREGINKKQKGETHYKSQQLRIDQILSFTKKMKKMEQNITKAKGESLELFLKYIQDRSKENEKIDHIYLFCSKQNLSWNKFKQTQEYKLIQDNSQFLDQFGQKKPCIDYLKTIEKKTMLNIFCFSKDKTVSKFYEDLKKQTICIKQLQFLSKQQFTQKVDLFSVRSLGQIIRNIPNKK